LYRLKVFTGSKLPDYQAEINTAIALLFQKHLAL